MVLEEKIRQLVEPTIESMDFEFWGCEYIPAGAQSTLRIFIEKPDVGVTVTDCSRVSRQVSAIMDVEDPISSAYMLEVSSPGMDRPLFEPKHYQAYKGDIVQIRASVAVMGRKRFKGEMVDVNEEGIIVEVDGEEYDIPFALIDKANLVPQF